MRNVRSKRSSRAVGGTRGTFGNQAEQVLRRGTSASLDVFLLSFPAGLIGSVVMAFAFLTAERVGWETPLGSLTGLTPWAAGCWMVATIMAEIICLSKWATTPGKRLLRLSVVTDQGDKLTVQGAMKRVVMKQLPFFSAALLWAPLVVALAAIWVGAWVRRGYMPHDKLTGTTVVPRE